MIFPRRRVPVLPWILPVLLPGSAAAQDPGTGDEAASYFRALGEHFRVSPAEFEVLAAWDLPPDHLAVVLFVADRSNGSPDALIAQRRRGLSWSDVARSFGLDASSFHVVVPPDAPRGRLTAVYERFASTPRTRWSSIVLDDAEVVDLVNLGFLASATGVPPGRVLDVVADAGSWVAAGDRLLATRWDSGHRLLGVR